MIDKSGQLLAAFSFIAFVLLIPPFVFHWRNKNIPACSLIFWLCFSNLSGFINALIWSGDNFHEVTQGKGYCDVVVRVTSGAPTGKLACTMTLMFNLYMIIDAKHARFLDPHSTRRVFINVAMCWLLPIFVMATSLLVQNSRYYIVRYRGCTASFSLTWLTQLLVNVWPLVFTFGAAVFAVLTVWIFWHKRRDASDILKCTNSGLDLKLFARLLVFSFLIIFVFAPFNIHNFVQNIHTLGIHRFSLAEVHSETWGEIWPIDPGFTSMGSRIIDMVLSACTFVLFGLGKDLLKMYQDALAAIGIRRSQTMLEPLGMGSPLSSKEATRQDTAATVVNPHWEKFGTDEVERSPTLNESGSLDEESMASSNDALDSDCIHFTFAVSNKQN